MQSLVLLSRWFCTFFFFQLKNIRTRMRCRLERQYGDLGPGMEKIPGGQKESQRR